MNVSIYNFSLQKRLESLNAAPISDVNKKRFSILLIDVLQELE